MSKTMFVKSNCPECGARLNVDVAQESMKCEYCGTISRIADKKKPPSEKANTQGGNIQPVIWVSTSGNFAWTWILSAILPIAIFGFVFYTVSSKVPFGTMFTGSGSGTASTSTGTAAQSVAENMQWVGYKHPMLVDINGDGVMDVIGWIRAVNMSGGDSSDGLGAFDAVTGNRLWDTGPLINSSQGGSDIHAALAGDKLLVADSTGVLKAFSLATGAIVWQGVLGERADRICGAEAGFAAVYTKDNRILKVPLATGQMMPAGQWKYETPCPSLQNDSDSTGPFFVKDNLSRRPIHPTGARALESRDLQGMNIEDVLTDLSTNKTVALGSRSPGTRSPVASAFQQTVSGKGKAAYQSLWLSSVTPLNPLTVSEGDPEQAAAAAGRVVVVYEMQDSKSGQRLSCLDENTGQILWDVSIPKSDTGTTGPITASPHHVFVPHWTYLDIFQLVDGAHKMTIGAW